MARHIREEVGQKIFEEYYKFAFVRNPYDRCVSQYVYMKGRRDLREFIGLDANDSFNRYLSLIQKKEHVQWIPQYKFIYDDNGRLLVDFVGKLENFREDVYKVLDAINYRRKVLGVNTAMIPHLNKGKRRQYWRYYDDEDREMVEALYGKDLEIFGYRFEK